MSDKVTDFPQYRKLSNGKVFYRINDERSFEEIQIIGRSAQLFITKAEQYPEMLRIQDMLNYEHDAYLQSTREEYDQLLNHYALSGS